LCTPLKWRLDHSNNIVEYGGYLRNEIEQVSFITNRFSHNNRKLNGLMVDTINRLNSIKYCVNLELLDYLKKDGVSLLKPMQLKNKYIVPYSLYISELFAGIDFYLPTFMDWRGVYIVKTLILIIKVLT
jgi:hypothetical protein